MKLSGSTTKPIGLDISDLSLKAVQLTKRRDKIKIQALSKQKIPAGLIEDGVIVDKKAILKILSKLLAQPQYGIFNTNEVMSRLPVTKTFIKLININKTPNNISDIISNEIEKHIPFSINEIIYDWQIINNTHDYSQVLIGAAPTETVDQYIDLLKDAKLSLLAMEIEPVSICRCLLKEESPKFSDKGRNVGILDIGAKRTSMTVYSGNSIALSISMPISGQSVTDEVAKTLDIQNDQAEKAKILCGFDKNMAKGIVGKILSGMLNNLIEKITETNDYFEAHYDELGPLEEIILCGGGSNIKNITSIISEKLNIKTSIGDVFTHLLLPDTKLNKVLLESHNLSMVLNGKNNDQPLGAKQNSNLSFATAIGLGLRPIFTDKI